jgi:peptidoglycan/LPS O-acetylase OafA/YrhL
MKLFYRPEIDGLRALAVFIVILYHSQFIFLEKELFSGGFIGVDIFFVISGYLISSIIIKEISSTKNFSFRNFYERRARRILPVLLVILLTTMILAYFLLYPSYSVQVSESILYSIGFSSNILFWLQSVEYGANRGFGIPL